MNKTYEVPERKICRKCGEDKPVSEFNLHHAHTRGHSKYRGDCKKCQAIYREENSDKYKRRGLEYRIKNADKIKQRKKEYLSNPENLEKHRAYAREYGRNRPEMQRNRLVKKYGLTTEEYDVLLEKQNGCCAICGAENNGKTKNFAIDHDHTTGKVRGLLCTKCNTALGRMQDSVTILRKAAEYLETFNP